MPGDNPQTTTPQTAPVVTPERIAEEVIALRRYLHVALGSVALLSSHLDGSIVIEGYLKAALKLCPRTMEIANGQ